MNVNSRCFRAQSRAKIGNNNVRCTRIRGRGGFFMSIERCILLVVRGFSYMYEYEEVDGERKRKS